MELMRDYRILKEGRDFYVLPNDEITRGSRAKRLVYTKNGRKQAIFKYDDGIKYRNGEDCSEKIASELAKALGHEAANIELAESISGEPGILSYLFIDKSKGENHYDAEDLLGINKNNERQEYSIKNIHRRLEADFPDVDFGDFLKIVVFDALVGERDRHTGNWGITVKPHDIGRKISPMYDTANCLLLHFQNEEYMNNKVRDDETFHKFINKNHLALYTDDYSKNYSPPVSVIEYLIKEYPDFMKSEIGIIKDKLKDGLIDHIVDKVPDSRIPLARKTYIKRFLKMQRDDIIKKGEEYENI